ncbi:MAG: FMN-binding glutamate synthase family protein, partial [Gammaproteobacteria bacterium]|nr:FMN-binding glutamate synthase family protein [Gammaproteobacteria bacterium]
MDINLNTLQHFALAFFEISAVVITLAIGVLVLAVIYMYLVDVRQTRHTIRRNYPVLGRFRYLFEH